jgi:hypothetical protein
MVEDLAFSVFRSLIFFAADRAGMEAALDGGVVGGEQEHWRPRPAAYEGQVTATPDSLRQMKVRAPWP